MLTITRKLEFDAGHRIPNHSSKCKNIHGHRYVLEVTVAGPLQRTQGASDEGMVVDFSIVKEVMNEHVVDKWDHAFLCWEHDTVMLTALRQFPSDHKHVILREVPTVENLAKRAFALLGLPFIEYGLRLVHLRLFETPNCWAELHDFNYQEGRSDASAIKD